MVAKASPPPQLRRSTRKSQPQTTVKSEDEASVEPTPAKSPTTSAVKRRPEPDSPSSLSSSPLSSLSPSPSPAAKKRVKSEPSSPSSPATKRVKTEFASPSPETKPRLKTEAHAGRSPAKTAAEREASLLARKLKSFAAHVGQSPFPDWGRPTPQECALTHDTLARLHGDHVRPDKVVAPTAKAGCGNSPSVLDALVRTVLSQNTSDGNSSRAKRSMDQVYGGSDRWDAIVEGGQSQLQQAIRSGGLSVNKSKTIIGILRETKEKYGVYSLDHLFHASDYDAMRELLSLKGVGPKTASCVMLFCLGRNSFAVDTHVYRLTGLMGWRPPKATREEAQAHLDALIPNDEKFALHVLLITHGKKCAECRAGGKNLGKCELRKLSGKATAPRARSTKP